MRSVTCSMRILGGILALAAILAGPPIAFWTFREVLVPSRIHSAGDALALLLAPDNGQVFLTLLVVAGTVAWLQLAAGVVMEAAGSLRGLPFRRVAGLGWARKIAAAVLLLVIGSATAAVAAEPAAAPASYLVRPGDSLMRIAAEQLGDESRYTEIFALNRTRRQPDGETLHDVALIKPGWQLDLPATQATGYSVQAGETLTSIARDRLGSASRYPEIVRLNSNVRDPNRIWAGETLHLPIAAPSSQAPRSPNLRPATPPPISKHAPVVPVPRTASAPAAASSVNTPLVVAGAAGLAVAAVLTTVGLRRLRAARRYSGAEPDGTGLDPLEVLDLALRQLARNADEEGTKLPDIRMIRVGAEHAEAFLDESAEAIPPFTGTDARWQLVYQDIPRDPDDGDAPHPTLTVLGHDPDGDLVVLGLDGAGALLLDGEPDDVAEVACALALELSTSPWATDVVVDFVGPLLDDAEQLERHESVDAVLERLADTSGDRPHVVIVAGPLAAEDAENLATSDAAADIVAVVAGAHPDTRIPGAWELDLRQDPTPIDQLGIQVALQRIHAGETAIPADSEPAGTPADMEPDLRDNIEIPADTGLEPDVPELRLLGPVSLNGVDYSRVEGKKINRLTELAAFLALNPGAHAGKVSEQLGTSARPWSAATRQGYISRLRNWLGHTPDGDLYLPNIDAKNPGYRLADSLRCDWFQFQRLVKAAGGDGRTDLLQEALDLVEGTPLSDVPRGRYEWSSWYQREMIDQIVDVAHRLATAYREDGKLTLARRAAARGLRGDPSSELLSRDLLRVELAVGNSAAAAVIAEKLNEASHALGVPLEDETSDLLRELKQVAGRSAGTDPTAGHRAPQKQTTSGVS